MGMIYNDIFSGSGQPVLTNGKRTPYAFSQYNKRDRETYVVCTLCRLDPWIGLYVNDRFLTTGLWNEIDVKIATVLCKVTYSYYIFNTVSLVTLLIISIERFKITRQTVQIPRPITGKRRAAVIAGSWLIPVLMEIDTLLFAQIEQTKSTKICIRRYTDKINGKIYVFGYIALVLSFYSAIVLLSVTILRRISRPQAIEDSLSEVQRQQRKKRTRNAVKMVLYSLLLYSCCYVPFVIGHVIALSVNPCAEYKWPAVFFLAWYILPIGNSFLSPVIYCVCLSDFREAAKRLLCNGNKRYYLERRNSIEPSSRRTENTQM
ncbi:Somatostatin receptor type 5 [Exaiptasia diaphana]|nr:Somatostatin receptor type 5 [Exaiptasia diaphana]